MRRARKWLWWGFGAGVLVVLAALSWLTALVLELEAQETRSRATAAEQERVRLALWRMDAWLGPHLAREAARPFFEYRSFYAPERAYTRLLSPLEQGEVLAASPLLAFESDFMRLHFQGGAEEPWSSPQVPEGELWELARGSLLDEPRLERRRADLDELRALLDASALRSGVQQAEDDLVSLLGQAALAACVVPSQERDAGAEQVKNRIELGQRALSNIEAAGSQKWIAQQQYAEPSAPEPGPVLLGPLVPLWLGADELGEPRLAFVRRVDVGSRVLHQGFLVDWPRLASLLLEQARDLVPAATLRPLPGTERLVERQIDLAGSAGGHGGDSPEVGGLGEGWGARGELDAPRLASLPAWLVPGPLPAPALAAASPVRAGLVLTWLAGLVVLVSVGLALRAGLAYADERSRFASSVTHELRTPLTTFRMYSEMLARGMVEGERERREYLETLERESERLSNLVENVLAFARLEERGGRPRRERVSLTDLLSRHLPALEASARRAGLALECEAASNGSVSIDTDPDAVGQILSNLVDNACKYGRGPQGAPLELSLGLEERHVHIDLRDHGPGVPAAAERAIFRPFDRGGRDAADPSPGIGLGLALSRGLARNLGGDLTHTPAAGGGACFRLSLPRVPAS